MAYVRHPPSKPLRPQPAEPPSLPAAHKYDSAVGSMRRLLFGRALATSQAGHQRLPDFLALPIFPSDALSSNAYATEASWASCCDGRQPGERGGAALRHPGRHRHLPAAGDGGAVPSVEISCVPDGGGAGTRSRRGRRGHPASLIAAASLLVDYG